jgi:manganese/zinc/iron transport system permease protein
LAGALLTGLLGVCLVAFLRRWTRIKEDAAIGIVLSVFFGAGIALSRVIQNTMATGAKAGLDSYILGKTAGMISQDVTWIAGVSLFSLLVVLLVYKEFKLASFDSGFANAQGWPALVLDLAMMGLVAVTVVLGLPAVGVVLMAALLILPGAAARFWTDRLGRMLLLSALFGTLIGGVGTSLSARYSGMPAGPIIVLVGTAVFLVSVLFAPQRGGVSRLIAVQSMRRKIQEQKLLRTLLESEDAMPDDLHGRLASLARQGLIEPTAAGRFRLTEAGSAKAGEVARAHRVWQRFLERNPQMAATLVDLDAGALEEQLSPEMIRSLETTA